MKGRIRRAINRLKVKLKMFKNKFKIINKHLKEQISMKDIKKYILKKPKRFIRRFKNSKNRFAFILNFILGSRISIVLLLILLLAKTMMFYRNLNLEFSAFDYTNIMSFVFLLIIICPLFFIKKDKNRFRGVIIFDIFLSALLFADNLYWDYSANMLSFSQILYVKYAEEIGGTLPYLLDFSHLIYLIDIPLLLLLWHIAKKTKKGKKTQYIKNKGKRRLLAGVIYTLTIILISAPAMVLCFDTIRENPYLKQRQVGAGTIYGYHYFDIYTSLNKKETTKYKTKADVLTVYNELNEYYEENYKKEDLYGIAKNKNVIILQLESLQNFLVNRTINGKEITPNFNRFLEENIRIANMNVQSYSTTADSEYSVITSLFPLDNGEAFSRYYASINNDIFSLYKNAGYNTSYMHGNVKEFWNRDNVYKRLPVDNISFLNEFEDTSEIIANYLSDELLYRQAVSKLKSYEEPFLTYIVAASSHVPFDLEGIEDRDKKVMIDIGKYRNTELGNYLEAANYADYAFGVFLDELKEKGLYDDTVIIVFGDHYGLSMGNEELEDFLRNVEPDYNEISKYMTYTELLCGMKVPGMESRKIEVPVSKVDIKPTLLELSGIEDNFSLGKSIFSNKDYAYINNGNIILEDYFYNEFWFDIKTGMPIYMDELDENTRRKLLKHEENVIKELDISSSITINNLFK